MSGEAAKLIAIIEASGLEEGMKAKWREFLPSLPEFSLADLVEALDHHPKLLKWLSENWRMKESVMREGGEEKWNEVLAKEREEFEDILRHSGEY